MRWERKSSRYAAPPRPRSPQTWSYGSNPVTESRALTAVTSLAVVALASVVATTTAGCGGGSGPSGAEAPVRPGAVAGASDPAGTAAESSSGTASGTASTAPSSGEPTGPGERTAEGAEQVVAGYFREINEASAAGRVADVTATALSGCQRCAHDVANTRLIEARGLHADVGPYAVSGLAGGDPAGVGVTVEFTVALVEVRLLDHAGRETERTAAGPSRHGTAELTFTANSWRIRSLDYAPG